MAGGVRGGVYTRRSEESCEEFTRRNDEERGGFGGGFRWEKRNAETNAMQRVRVAGSIRDEYYYY